MTPPRGRPHCAVFTCLSPTQPGFLDFAYRVQALAEHHDVTLISNLPLDIPEFDIPGVSRLPFAMRPGQVGWLQFLTRCARWLHQERPDRVMLLHTAVAPLTFACRLLGIPAVLYWNEHPTHLAPPCGWGQPLSKLVRGTMRRLMAQGARAADVVMPIGEAHQEDLRTLGVRPQRLKLLPMGVAQAFRGPMRQPATAPCPLQLIYIGTVAPERGQDVMLEAMHLLAAQAIGPLDVHLTMVGVLPDQMPALQQRVQSQGLTDQVTLVGRVPGHQVPDLLAQAHLGICLWEDLIWYRFNPPTKLFEYLVAGLPVLASRIRTHTAYVQDGVNGLIFDYSPDGLAQAISRLVRQDVDWLSLSQQAWHSGEAYLWAHIKPRFLQIFNEARC